MINAKFCPRRLLTPLAILGIATLSAQVLAAPPWVDQGPGPAFFGQVEGLANRAVNGAINAIAASPIDANLVYAGTVNGGIWKTTNATSASPSWIPLTDLALPALSINSLAFSPLDANTLFAGTGSTSSDAFDGSPGFGVARSLDGGSTWTVLAASTFNGRRINSIVPTTLNNGSVVLAATLFDSGGVYRSVDKGVTFSHISNNGISHLPNAGVSRLVSDPGNSLRFYAGVPKNFAALSSDAGVYRSDDGGVTWTQKNTGLSGLDTSSRILLSVYNGASGNVVYAAILNENTGGISGVFRSANQGGSWTSMGVPSPNIFPGQQSIVHGAIVADPNNPNVVFLSGDRQDAPFPNINGARNYTANVFRGVFSSGNNSTAWQNLVDNGANGTSPHADSRAMVFDANGDLLQANDGGIFRLVNPNTAATRTWVGVGGDIRCAELVSTAYDSYSGIVIGGAQDIGALYQSTPGNQVWYTLLQGDGGVAAVDADQSAHPGYSRRYNCYTFLQTFIRSYWDASNTFLGYNSVRLNIVSGPASGLELHRVDPNIQFYNPYVLNQVDPSRMLIGTANIYESLDGGDSLYDLGFTGYYINSLTYGSRLSGVLKPDVFYVGAGPMLLHRVSASDPVSALTNYPGSFIRSVVMDPQNYKKVYVADDQNRVWVSTDEGVHWVNITANLGSLCSSVRTLEIYSPDASIKNTVLIGGGLGGVFQMKRPGAAGASWTALSSDFPHALVLDLHYNYVDNVLVAGTQGRGAWTITNPFQSGPRPQSIHVHQYAPPSAPDLAEIGLDVKSPPKRNP